MVIIQGRTEREEFREPFRQCTEMTAEIGAAYRLNPAWIEETADFFLFFQSYPHEFPRQGLTQLRRQHPFTPFFFVLGACCEGMLRTAGPLDSPFYCYAHGWSNREAEQMCRFLTDQPSVFSLPLTAEQDEIALWFTPRLLGGREEAAGMENGTEFRECLVLTQFGPFGNDSAMNRLLADEQRRLGFEPLFFPSLSSSACRLPPDARFSGKIVADTDESPREKILESIQRLRHQFADNDFTVYVDSPRIDEKNDYLQAGVTRVLPKIQ